MLNRRHRRAADGPGPGADRLGQSGLGGAAVLTTMFFSTICGSSLGHHRGHRLGDDSRMERRGYPRPFAASVVASAASWGSCRRRCR